MILLRRCDGLLGCLLQRVGCSHAYHQSNVIVAPAGRDGDIVGQVQRCFAIHCHRASPPPASPLSGAGAADLALAELDISLFNIFSILLPNEIQ